MRIRIDTREQSPLDFSAYPDTTVVTGTVSVFDYALDGDQKSFAIERKSLQDFVQAVVMKASYTRELEKIRKARQAGMLRLYYVVEAAFQDVESFDYSLFRSGKVHPGLVYSRWREFTHLRGINIIFAGDQFGAAKAVYLLLKSRAEELKSQST